MKRLNGVLDYYSKQDLAVVQTHSHLGHAQLEVSGLCNVGLVYECTPRKERLNTKHRLLPTHPLIHLSPTGFHLEQCKGEH